MSKYGLTALFILMVVSACSTAPAETPEAKTRVVPSIRSTSTIVITRDPLPSATPYDSCLTYDVHSVPLAESTYFENGLLAEIGTGHLCDVYGKTIAFSPDGIELALANYDGVRLYSTQSGELLGLLPGDGIWNVAFSPDGKILASISVNQEVTLWNLAEGEVIDNMRPADEPVAWVISATGVAYSSDGSRLTAWFGTADQEPIRVWDVISRDLLATVPLTLSNAIAISPDGRYLVNGSDVGWELYNITTQEIILTSTGREPVSYIAFSSDGQQLYTTNWFNGHVTAWDATTGEKLYSFGDCDATCEAEGPMDLYARFGLSEDGSRLVAIDPYPTANVYVWDTRAKKLIDSFDSGRFVNDVAISRDGKLIAALSQLEDEDGYRVFLWHLSP